MKKSSGIAAGLVALALLGAGVTRQMLKAPSPPLPTASETVVAEEAARAVEPAEASGARSDRVDTPSPGPVAWRPPPSREGHTQPPGSLHDRHARRVDSSAKTAGAKAPRESATQWIADYQRET